MIIQIETKSVYGIVKLYPVNEAAKALCALTRTKTLSVADIQNARKLGHVIEDVTPRMQFAGVPA